MSEFETNWQWRVIIIGGGYKDGRSTLEKALNESWTIVKSIPNDNFLVFVLKNLKGVDTE